MKRLSDLAWEVITSLKLTIVCLVSLMVLVVACTLAQVDLGTFGAVEVYMYSFLVWWHVPGTVYLVPVFPGGALVGAVLLTNLIAAQVRRLEFSWKKSGIWIVHVGLLLLVTGQFITGLAQRETQLFVEEGQTVNFVTSPREMELALVDTSDPTYDDVFSVPASVLARGSDVRLPGTPVVLRVHGYEKNSLVENRKDEDPPNPATKGFGTMVTVIPEAPVSKDGEENRSAAYVEPIVAGESEGIYLVSNGIEKAQTFVAGGHSYTLAMRNLREYLPYAVTLKKFRHDVYTGTNIPKNFSSLVHIENPSRGESRDALIYMNQPLRYAGKAFYQSSFGKNDTLSILQVVENPGWLLPYVSCALVGIGLLVHFAIIFRRSLIGQRAKAARAREDGSPRPSSAATEV